MAAYIMLVVALSVVAVNVFVLALAISYSLRS